GLGFLQKPDDLLFRKALLHVRLLLRKRTLLDSGWPCLQGAGQVHVKFANPHLRTHNNERRHPRCSGRLPA
ncbi:hypothetical protein KTD15_29230, partial [Burkholderia multivorans]|uniref:hypothetical protein n=1 Tax=Burkholderia multivorans TaxID=87883 RepID=UPI001C21D7B8